MLLIPVALETWLENPPTRTEWVDGQLVKKSDMTLKHSKVQRRLSTLWGNYQDEHGLGGEVYTLDHRHHHRSETDFCPQ